MKTIITSLEPSVSKYWRCWQVCRSLYLGIAG